MTNPKSGNHFDKLKRAGLLTLAILATLALFPVAMYFFPQIMSFK